MNTNNISWDSKGLELVNNLCESDRTRAPFVAGMTNKSEERKSVKSYNLDFSNSATWMADLGAICCFPTSEVASETNTKYANDKYTNEG